MTLRWTDIWYGTDAAKPAAGVAGRLAYATDTKILYRDTGIAWVEIVRGETATRLASLAEKSHASLTGVLTDQHHSKVHGIADHDASAKAIIDISLDTAALTPVIGAWTDLLTVSRTIAEARKVSIHAGFVFYNGATAQNLQCRILVNGTQDGLSWRAVLLDVNRYGCLETHRLVSLAAGTHTIKIQYNVSHSGTIYDRDLSVLWVE